MRALGLWRTLGNDYELARSLSQLGNQIRHTARSVEAYRCFDEGIRLSEEREFRLIEGLNRIGLAETMYAGERTDKVGGWLIRWPASPSWILTTTGSTAGARC